MEFKNYQVVANIDFINNKETCGNYHTESNYLSEIKAINHYKDSVWDIQGLFNNIIMSSDNFEMIGYVTLYGITLRNDMVVIRHTDFNI